MEETIVMSRNILSSKTEERGKFPNDTEAMKWIEDHRKEKSILEERWIKSPQKHYVRMTSRPPTRKMKCPHCGKNINSSDKVLES